MGLMDRAKKAWAEKQEKWAEESEKEEAEKAKISEKFEEIIVPTHDITEVKRGKRVQRKKNISLVMY